MTHSHIYIYYIYDYICIYAHIFFASLEFPPGLKRKRQLETHFPRDTSGLLCRWAVRWTRRAWRPKAQKWVTRLFSPSPSCLWPGESICLLFLFPGRGPPLVDWNMYVFYLAFALLLFPFECGSLMFKRETRCFQRKSFRPDRAINLSSETKRPPARQRNLIGFLVLQVLVDFP